MKNGDISLQKNILNYSEIMGRKWKWNIGIHSILKGKKKISNNYLKERAKYKSDAAIFKNSKMIL